MEVVVTFGDESGHATSRQAWSSTVLSAAEGYLLAGDSIDWSDPDEGIFFRRMFASCEDGEEGELFDFLGEDEGRSRPGSVCVFGRQDMERALAVVVDGLLVLERAPGGEPADFACGLRWPVYDEGPGDGAMGDMPAGLICGQAMPRACGEP